MSGRGLSHDEREERREDDEKGDEGRVDWVVGFGGRSGSLSRGDGGDGRDSAKSLSLQVTEIRREKEWAPKRSDNSSLNINLSNNACVRSPPWLGPS